MRAARFLSGAVGCSARGRRWLRRHVQRPWISSEVYILLQSRGCVLKPAGQRWGGGSSLHGRRHALINRARFVRPPRRCHLGAHAFARMLEHLNPSVEHIPAVRRGTYRSLGFAGRGCVGENCAFIIVDQGAKSGPFCPRAFIIIDQPDVEV